MKANIAGMPGWKRDLGKPASRLIDQRIRDLGDGAGDPGRMRALILKPTPR